MRPEETSRWVFNRVADVYAARPAYPTALIDALSELIPANGRVGDIGAGTGNLALPLAGRGFDVVAVEPAELMLERLHAGARDRGLALRSFHATAEALPLEASSLDLAVVADALHFFNVELAASELYRVLMRRGWLAIVTVDFGTTPYMRAVARVVEEESQRRPRQIGAGVAQLGALARAPLRLVRRFDDETEMDTRTLERMLRSFSFVGPAMNEARFAKFRERILALDERPVWTRTFTLHAGRKALRARAPGSA